MPLLRSVADQRRRLGFIDNPDINDALQGEMEIAIETVADRLRTGSLERVDVVDTFFVNESLRFQQSATPSRAVGRRTATTTFGTQDVATASLKLSRGFVDTGQTWTAYAAGTEDGLDETTRTDLKAVSGTGTDHTSLMDEAGFLRVNDFNMRNTYVRVSYKAGFLDDGGDPGLYIGFPRWIQAAFDIECRLLTNANAVFGREQVWEKEQKRLEGRLNNILKSHSRYFPLTTWKPIFCAATASAT